MKDNVFITLFLKIILMNFNVPCELEYEVRNDKVRFSIGDLSTNWMGKDDPFIERIETDNLNKEFMLKHLTCEIKIRNALDEGIALFKAEKYSKAIQKFDEVLFYDPEYGLCLLNKSFCLRAQRHFVKSLRYYKRAIRCDGSLKDIEYNKVLLKEANNERDNFPKLKLNIYAGDESFSKGEYEKAVASYDRALMNPSKFKDKILSKLLNKKATALLRLKDFENAYSCFKESSKVGANDYAVFGMGCCEYELNLDVNAKFKGLLDISKRQMLRQILILNDLGYFRESLEICDFLAERHFRADELYFALTDVRNVAILQINAEKI